MGRLSVRLKHTCVVNLLAINWCCWRVHNALRAAQATRSGYDNISYDNPWIERRTAQQCITQIETLISLGLCNGLSYIECTRRGFITEWVNAILPTCNARGKRRRTALLNRVCLSIRTAIAGIWNGVLGTIVLQWEIETRDPKLMPCYLFVIHVRIKSRALCPVGHDRHWFDENGRAEEELTERKMGSILVDIEIRCLSECALRRPMGASRASEMWRWKSSFHTTFTLGCIAKYR